MADELLEGAERWWALGDRNHLSQRPTERLEEQRLELLASYKSKKRKKAP
jgi:hypothetical protein